jgi:opacity protein-like surface antigen
MKARLSVLLLLTVFALSPSSLFAQAAEINPYGGYIWPGDNDQVGEFMNTTLLGVRGGGYITKNFELGGNWAATNHFQPKSSNEPAAFAGALGFPQGRVKAMVYEAEFSYNFGQRDWFGSRVKPYVVGGIGGLTTKIKNLKDDESNSIETSCAQLGSDEKCFVLNTRPVIVQTNINNQIIQTVEHVPNDILESRDTFLTFSYGGGIKIHRVWGPMGFFGDFRGRTIPNFFSKSTTSPEISAGLSFSWGER